MLGTNGTLPARTNSVAAGSLQRYLFARWRLIRRRRLSTPPAFTTTDFRQRSDVGYSRESRSTLPPPRLAKETALSGTGFPSAVNLRPTESGSRTRSQRVEGPSLSATSSIQAATRSRETSLLPIASVRNACTSGSSAARRARRRLSAQRLGGPTPALRCQRPPRVVSWCRSASRGADGRPPGADWRIHVQGPLLCLTSGRGAAGASFSFCAAGER